MHMVVVVIEGQMHEVTGRLASIILWLIEQSDRITHGHKTIEVECYGKVVKPRLIDHFDQRT